jgi:phosphohistidine phosphatase
MGNMRTLMLLRHAKSSWKDESLEDHERPLNKRGKKTAPLMGHLIRDQNLVPDQIASSTAVRARTTAEAAAKACGYPGELTLTDELYLATAGEILRYAQERPDETHHRIMLVGHNPGMEDLVNMLSGRREPFPTAALAVFELEIDSWRKLELGVHTKLMELWRPKELE